VGAQEFQFDESPDRLQASRVTQPGVTSVMPRPLRYRTESRPFKHTWVRAVAVVPRPDSTSATASSTWLPHRSIVDGLLHRSPFEMGTVQMHSAVQHARRALHESVRLGDARLAALSRLQLAAALTIADQLGEAAEHHPAPSSPGTSPTGGAGDAPWRDQAAASRPFRNSALPVA
jgi:hypothetical protein